MSVGTCVPGYTTVSVDIQHVFVGTLDVAVDTHLIKHLYQWVYICLWIDSLYCFHTKKLSYLKSGVEFDMNDIFYEFKYLHHF